MGTAPSSNYESYTGVAISGILAPPGREERGVGGGERRHPSFSGANVALIKSTPTVLFTKRKSGDDSFVNTVSPNVSGCSRRI